jgi:cyclophilin family peptidyl-prolyl cis-trans isomerase
MREVTGTPGSLIYAAPMRRAAVPIVILLAALLIAACGKESPIGGTDESTATTAQTTATSTTPAIPPRSARDGCKAVPAPQPSSTPTRRRSRTQLTVKRSHIAVLTTNCGTIRILLAVRRAPKTTSSFAGLVRNGFYDGLTFHRIAKPGGNDYVIQGGDPLGDGNGGPGYSVVEKPAKNTRYDRLVVAMAKTPTDPPGTSGSQFFIVTAERAELPPEYALLGRVIGSDTVVRRIARLATDPVSEMPVDPVVIERARILSR